MGLLARCPKCYVRTRYSPNEMVYREWYTTKDGVEVKKAFIQCFNCDARITVGTMRVYSDGSMKYEVEEND